MQAKAQELAMRAMDVIQRDAGPGHAVLSAGGKFAAGQRQARRRPPWPGSGYEPETGFVLAVLKRCLNWLNEAVGACQQLIDAGARSRPKAALEHIRSSAFEIRDRIVELRRELK